MLPRPAPPQPKEPPASNEKGARLPWLGKLAPGLSPPQLEEEVKNKCDLKANQAGVDQLVELAPAGCGRVLSGLDH